MRCLWTLVTFNDNCALVGMNHNMRMKMMDIFVRIDHEKVCIFSVPRAVRSCLTVCSVNVYELLLVETKIEIKTFIIFPLNQKTDII